MISSRSTRVVEHNLKFAPLVTPAQRYVSTILAVSMAFLF